MFIQAQVKFLYGPINGVPFILTNRQVDIVLIGFNHLPYVSACKLLLKHEICEMKVRIIHRNNMNNIICILVKGFCNIRMIKDTEISRTYIRETENGPFWALSVMPKTQLPYWGFKTSYSSVTYLHFYSMCLKQASLWAESHLTHLAQFHKLSISNLSWIH